jgi:tetratricopeptide (TPR) repeat protein
MPVLAVCGFLLAAVLGIFGKTAGYEFCNFDDDDYVYHNRIVARGLTAEGFTWAFVGHHAGNWHPLTWLSHMVDCQLYGLHAGGHHAGNVLLHGITVVGLFLILLRMTGAFWPAAVAATLFAIHPLRTESVAWIAERKDVLSGLFLMLTLGAYVSYARRAFSAWRFLAVLALFAMGLMAKPMLVTLPLLLLLLDYWPLRRVTGWHFPRRVVWEKIPLLLLAAGSCMLTLWAQQEALELNEQVVPLWRLGHALLSYVVYLKMFFCPLGLTVLYLYPQEGPQAWQAVGALILLAGISAGAVAVRRKHPYLLVGWLWYLVALLPVIGLLQVGFQARADHYTYLPHIGLAIAVAWGGWRLCRSWPGGRRAYLVAAAGTVAALMACSWRQTSFWYNSETLWRRAVACNSENFVAHHNLGLALVAQGNVEEAAAHYHRALAISPRYTHAYNNLGNLLASQGRGDEAVAAYQECLRLNPDYAEAHYNLANVLREQGQVAAASVHYRRALERNPEYAEAHNNLANTLFEQGQMAAAIAHFQQALQLNPQYVEAHNNLGNALFHQGQAAEAISQYQQALDLDPNYIGAHYNLAISLNQMGRLDEAIVHYRQTLQIDPRHTGARSGLGIALYQQGNPAQAVPLWRESLRAEPNQVLILNLAAWVLATSPDATVRNGAEAIELAERAVRLSGSQDPALLDTLAAAYAEAGRFPQAVQVARQALTLAAAQNRNHLTAVLPGRIRLYESGSAYRQR